jgi:peptide/nickel transport system substrate-binding protein
MNALKKQGKVCRWFAAAMICFAAATGAQAQQFKLALSAPPMSMDPHFYNLTSTINVSAHIFEALTKMDALGKPVAGLAESWKAVDNLTWEFKLRKGVKFHDGSELTADDVLWSLDRPATIVNSPGKFDVYTKEIVGKKIVDPHTIQLTTREPYPLLPADLVNIFIVSKKATQGLKSEDFSSGRGMIGTGPFKFVKFQRDDRVELDRNDAYWDKPAAWNKVTLRFIPNDPTRLAALLSGDVQAIENVPTPDIRRLQNEPKVALFSKVSQRLIYFFVDSARDKSPFVTDKSGSALDKNPLKDLRVRQAMSMAINREAIKERIMEGLAEPANNLVPSGMSGNNPGLKVPKYDPDGAKRLLAEAGYPNGFGLTIHTPNNRYVNDEKIAQTVAQMLSRIGIATKVEAMPIAVYSGRATKGDFSVGLFGWAAQTGEASSPLRALLACPDAKTGFGSNNRGRYCNPKMDDQLKMALQTLDDAARLKLLQDAAATALNDVGLIPLHHQVTSWAARKGISYTGRVDEATHAYGFRPQASQ